MYRGKKKHSKFCFHSTSNGISIFQNIPRLGFDNKNISSKWKQRIVKLLNDGIQLWRWRKFEQIS